MADATRADGKAIPEEETRLGGRLKYLLYRPWAWFVYFPYLLLSTALMGSLAAFCSLFSKRWAFRCGTLWSMGLLAMNFTRVRVRGKENIENNRSYVIMPNHSSLCDIPALASIWAWQFRWVMKEELRHVPFLGWGCAAIGNVFIDRSNRQAAVASLQAAIPMLAGGVSLMIFPEGTRSDQGLGPLKKGGFMVALDSGLPILPVSIRGSEKVLPNKTVKIMPGVVELVVHPAIDPQTYGHEGRDQLMHDVRSAIASGLGDQS